MKNLLITIIAILALITSCNNLFAQAPNGVNYQAVVRGPLGFPLNNQIVDVRFTIRTGSPTGSSVFTETQTDTTNQFGLINLELGAANTSAFSIINWGSGGAKYLQIEVDAGSGFDNLGASQLLSVPYALFAKSAATGVQGFNSLIDTVSATVAECSTGGFKVLMGLDTNANTVLDAAEITSSFLVCNGTTGAANLNDTSVTNEIQTISINTTSDTIFLSNGGGFVPLPTFGGDNDWVINGNDMSSGVTGNVGIGTTTTVHKLTVVSPDTVVASFTGTNPDASVISVWGFNPNAVVGTVFLSGTDSGIVALDPLQKTLFMSNTTTDGHVAIVGDSSTALYGQVIGNIATGKIVNQADSIFNISTTGTVFNINQGTFFTDSLYVLGGTNTSGYVLTNNGFGKAEWQPSSGGGSSLWSPNGVDAFYNTGNVAIGTTTTSAAKLNVVAPAFTPLLKLEGNGNAGSGLFVEYQESNGYHIMSNDSGGISFEATSSGVADKISFEAGNNERMRITGLGNIGIGTTNPQQLLTLSTGGSTTLRLERNSAAQFDWEMNVDNLGFHLKGGADATGAGLTDFLNIDGGGKMGLGITTPTQLLHLLNGTIRIDDGTNPYNLPTADGTANQVLTTNGSGVTSWQTPSTAISGWDLAGNTGTTNGVDFIGTTDAQDLDIRTNDTIRHRFTQQGQLEFLNTGQSVFLGAGAGANDDLSINLNTFVGDQAGNANISGVENVAVGSAALLTNTTGNSNVAVGREALRMNTTGAANTATGYRASQNNTTSAFNSSFGYEVLRFNQTGNRNSAFGTGGLTNSTGSNNSSFGADAGITLTSGNDNTFIGKSADAGIATLNNATAIGANAVVAQSNSLVLGNNVNVGIGTIAPNASLHIQDINAATGDRLLDVDDNAGNPLLSVLDNGNIGVGVATPTQALQVNGQILNNSPYVNSSTPHLRINNGNTSFNGGVLGALITASDNTSADKYAMQGYAEGNLGNKFSVYGNAGGSGGSKFAIYGVANGLGTNYGVYGIASGGTTNWAGYFTSGNVYIQNNLGIGTTTPTAKLDVIGITKTDSLIVTTNSGISGDVLTNDGTGNATWQVPNAGSRITDIGNNTFIEVDALGNGTEDIIHFTTNGVERMVLDNNGRFGIGIAPSAGAVMAILSNTENTLITLNAGKPSAFGGATSGISTAAFGASLGDNLGAEFSATNAAQKNIGVKARATSAGVENIGIKSSATGASTNWAGYFGDGSAGDGNVYIQDNVGIGTSSPTAKLDVRGITKTDSLIVTTNSGTSGDVLTNDGTGNAIWLPSGGASSGWDLAGNTGTSNGTHFIGTTDTQDLDIGTNSIIRHRFTQQGQLEFLNAGQSVFIGEFAGTNDNLTSTHSVFVGYKSGQSNLSGSNNTAIGYQSLEFNTSGNQNTAIGMQALNTMTIGNNNTAIGFNSLRDNTSVIGNNTAIGKDAGRSNLGSGNVFLGYQAGRNELGSNKLYIDNSSITTPLIYGDFSNDSLKINGTLSVLDGTEGTFGNVLTDDGFGNATWKAPAASASSRIQDVDNNTFIETDFTSNGLTDDIRFTINGLEHFRMKGSRIEFLGSNASVLIGQATGQAAGTQTTAIGHQALINSAGTSNTAIGYQSLFNTTGSNNTAIGSIAGNINTSGSNNTYLGNNANATAGQNNLTNSTAVGFGAEVSTSNSLILGNNANVGIGISAPLDLLHLAHNTQATAVIQTSGGAGSNGGRLVLERAQGNTLSPSSVAIGDELGRIEFSGFGLGTFEPGAMIRSQADEAFSSTGGGAHLEFHTAALGGFASEAMRITNSGNVGIGTTTPSEKLHIENGNLLINKGHIQSNGVAPTFTGFSVVGNDIAGMITMLVGGSETFTFNTAYTSAVSIIITPADPIAASSQYYVGSVTAVGFEVFAPTGSGTGRFYYQVIEY